MVIEMALCMALSCFEISDMEEREMAGMMKKGMPMMGGKGMPALPKVGPGGKVLPVVPRPALRGVPPGSKKK